MTQDILRAVGFLGLGSRLKRLAEKLQADAAEIHQSLGFPMQPSQFPLLCVIRREGELTITQAVELIGVSQPAITRTFSTLIEAGLVESRPHADDSRQKLMSLTDKGTSLVTDMETRLWPHIAVVAQKLCEPSGENFLNQLTLIENALLEKSLVNRVIEQVKMSASSSQRIEIIEYSPEYDQDFYEITREWVEDMFVLEANDIAIMEKPKELVIDRGGIILFARTEDLGIVGTCALFAIEDGVFELTKMGVRASARGRKIGESLLEATLQYARKMKMKSLYLLTNKKCEAAIHLYEKLGFKHDADILAKFGPRYERCNVAMSYDLT